MTTGNTGTETKKASGAMEKQTVVQLQPVKLQISLFYMGHDRIAKKAGTDNCNYELHHDTADAPGPAMIASTLLPNMVRGLLDTDPLAKPALSHLDAGTQANPAVDEIYRIVFLDNHGVSRKDLNDVFGGKLAKPGSYTKRKWMPNVSPAVPFRVVIKKFVGDTQVDMCDDVEVVIEIKDPREEFDQNDGNRRTFLESFFTKYNRTDANPSLGDDNGLKKFAGLREPSAGYPGCKATNLLKKATYKSPPVAGIGAPAPDAVAFSSLGSPTSVGSDRAAFSLKAVKDGDKQVGVTDFALLPPPVGGDNYRFLIRLRGTVSAGKTKATNKTDVREAKLNGQNIIVLDDASTELKGKCNYTTGRFVMWRKIEFRLMVLVNELTDDLDWDSISATYRKSFVELVRPARTFNITWQMWRDALQTVYHTSPPTDAWFTNTANLQTLFPTGLIPGTLEAGSDTDFQFSGGSDVYQFDLDPNVHAITRLLIKRACEAPTFNFTNPDGDDQKTSDGLFLMYARRLSPDTGDGTLGEYMGDRIFYMYPSTPVDTTDTCAHELGHALFLSHSTTHSQGFKYVRTDTTEIDLNIVEPTSNCAVHDHDAADNVSCLMSYTSSSNLLAYPYHPCGACALSLRFYDKIQFQNSKHYGDQMMSDVSPAVFIRYDETDTKLHEEIPSIAVNSVLYLLVVGKEKPWPASGGTTWDARLNLTGLSKVTSTGTGATPGKATVKESALKRIKVVTVTATKKGRVRLSFSHKGVNTTQEFEVT
jgi:hypothetical protein